MENADTEKPGAVQDRLDRLVEHAHKYLGPVVAQSFVLHSLFRCYFARRLLSFSARLEP